MIERFHLGSYIDAPAQWFLTSRHSYSAEKYSQRIPPLIVYVERTLSLWGRMDLVLMFEHPNAASVIVGRR